MQSFRGRVDEVSALVSAPFQPDGNREHEGAPAGGFYKTGLKGMQALLHTIHWLNSISIIWSYITARESGSVHRREHGLERVISAIPLMRSISGSPRGQKILDQ